jgi:hypothetical protein
VHVREIQGQARTILQLLSGVKYSIDYYQREYQWQTKQIQELVDDLADKFLQEFEPTHERKEVASYAPYFLGSIIVSKKEGANYIVDGQQRLTSLTLLLVLLRQLAADVPGVASLDMLIFSEQFGERSFNLDVPERRECMEALFEGRAVDVHEQSASVQNLQRRYVDLESSFPDELRKDALPYFVDWLLNRVYLVEITAYADEEAYTIFETMNDRGLSLTPTEMLRGFLLANISDEAKRASAEKIWRDEVRKLAEHGKEAEPDFFKTWLRSRYSTRIRQRTRGARPEDFDRIGTEFHRWLRDTEKDIGLLTSNDHFDFVARDLRFYSRWYRSLLDAAAAPSAGFEHVHFNAQLGFTLQYLLLLAPLTPADSDDVVRAKIGLVARFIDILLNWRIWNFRSIAYSTMQYSMFTVMRGIRGLDPKPLAEHLYEVLRNEDQTFATNDRLRLHQQNRNMLHRVLARLTDYVETESGLPSRYSDYVAGGKHRFEVEHIWANHPDRHTSEFQHEADFQEYRNRIGGLLLLPKSFNGSYGDKPYEAKLEHYFGQNLLAKSLHHRCYEHNPGFLAFIERSGLPFRPHPRFDKADLDERSALYERIAEQLWDPESLFAVATVSAAQ